MPTANTCPECVTVGALVQRVSRILNDDVRSKDGADDYTSWPRAVLIDFLNEGLSNLLSLRPDAFAETVVFELQPGIKQEIPDEYDALISVIGNIETDSSGREYIGSTIREQEDAGSFTVESKCSEDADCSAGGSAAEFSVDSFYSYAQTQTEFNVSPSVPTGRSVKVCARVVKNPPILCAGDEDECLPVARKFESYLVDWMIHRAHLRDIESQFAAASSTLAYNRFYNSIENARRAEARFGSGYYLGQIGDEDSRVGG